MPELEILSQSLGHTALDRRENGDALIEDALNRVRQHLGMEIGYLSEFVDDAIQFRALDAPDHGHLVQKGGVWPLDNSYCIHVSEGRLPSLIPDTSQNAFARGLAVTDQVPIRAHVSVPVKRADGSDYGMFCFLSSKPNPSLNERDLGIVEMFASLVQREVQRGLDQMEARDHRRVQVHAIIRDGAYDVFAQPILHLGSGDIKGYEALCRFHGAETLADKVFDAAGDVGLRAELESTIMAAALEGGSVLAGDTYLSVNAAPETVLSEGFAELFHRRDLDKTLLEMTEHQAVEDYSKLMAVLDPLREQGLRIAVDDAGTGYSGLLQILQLKPDIIKLDRALVTGLDTDPAKRSMAAAMVHYAGESGAVLLAEGVETEAEAETLRRLGVSHAQGYYFARPVPLSGLNAA